MSNRTAWNTWLAVVVTVMALSLVGLGIVASAEAEQQDPPRVITVGGLIDVGAEGDRVHLVGANEVHFKVVELPELRDGYLLVQLYVDATRDEKDAVGHPRNKALFKPAGAVQLPQPWDTLPACYVSKAGLWVPYKTTRNGGESWTYLLDRQWAAVLGR